VIEASASKPSRRRFIQGGLLFGAASFVAWHGFGRRPMGGDPPGSPVGLKDEQFRTLVSAFVELLDDEDAGLAAAAEIDAFLAGDPAQAAQMGMALTLLEMAPGGPLRPRRFSRLDRAGRRAALDSWQTSGWGTKRQIHKALREAARFVHFSQPETWVLFGYDGPWVGTL